VRVRVRRGGGWSYCNYQEVRWSWSYTRRYNHNHNNNNNNNDKRALPSSYDIHERARGHPIKQKTRRFSVFFLQTPSLIANTFNTSKARVHTRLRSAIERLFVRLIRPRTYGIHSLQFGSSPSVSLSRVAVDSTTSTKSHIYI